jgi:uncharacterized membrane protein
MSEQRHTEQTTFFAALRATFGRGLVLIIPVVITMWVLMWLFNAMDGVVAPLIDQFFGRHIPGLGFISMIAIILIVGALSRNLIGHAIFKFFERIVSTIPLARTIYGATKDLISAFQPGKSGKSFRQVVLVEYPRQGLFTIGFVTNSISIAGADQLNTDMVSIYIPNPPNPTSGVMVLVPRNQIRILDISVEAGLKLVLSGGIVTSGLLTAKKQQVYDGTE